MQKTTQRIGDIVRQSSVYSVGNFVNKVLLLTLVPVFSAYIAPSDLALLSLIEPAELLLYSFLSLGLIQAFFKEFGSSEDKVEAQARLVSTLLWLLLGIGILVGVSVFLLAEPIQGLLRLDHPMARTALYLAAGSFFFRILHPLASGHFQATKQAGLLSTLVVSGSLVYCLYAIFSLVLLGRDIDSVFEARVFILAPVAVVGVWSVRKKVRLVFDFPLLLKMLAFSLPFVITASSLPILNFSDRWFLNAFSGSADTGIYDISYRFGLIPNMVLVLPFLRAWQPDIYRDADPAQQEEVRSRTLLYFALAGLSLWLGLSVFRQELLQIFSTPAYEPGAVVIPYVAAAQILYGLGWIMISGLASQGKTIVMGVITFGGAMLNLALNAALIPRLGMLGAAIATVIAFAVIFVGYAGYSHLQAPQRWPARRFLVMIVISLLAFFAIDQVPDQGLIVNILLKGSLLIPLVALLVHQAGLDFRKIGDILSTLKRK